MYMIVFEYLFSVCPFVYELFVFIVFFFISVYFLCMFLYYCMYPQKGENKEYLSIYLLGVLSKRVQLLYAIIQQISLNFKTSENSSLSARNPLLNQRQQRARTQYEPRHDKTNKVTVRPAKTGSD